MAIHSRGGATIAQSPTDALFPAMPLHAIEAGVVDHEIAATKMEAKLSRRLAGLVYPGKLSDGYQAIPGEAEHAMAVPGHWLSKAYKLREHGD